MRERHRPEVRWCASHSNRVRIGILAGCDHHGKFDATQSKEASRTRGRRVAIILIVIHPGLLWHPEHVAHLALVYYRFHALCPKSWGLR